MSRDSAWFIGARGTELYELFIGAAPTPRKSRLFLVSCFRRLWPSAPIQLFHDAAELAECYADSFASEAQRVSVWEALHRFSRRVHFAPGKGKRFTDATKAGSLAYRAVSSDNGIRVQCYYMVLKADPDTRAALWPVFHDLFGNSTAVTIEPSWLAWNDATVKRLANAVYLDRAFDHLPVLADALEEAGCTDTAILDHCRGGGPHVRGCWVVDLILGKE